MREKPPLKQLNKQNETNNPLLDSLLVSELKQTKTNRKSFTPRPKLTQELLFSSLGFLHLYKALCRISFSENQTVNLRLLCDTYEEWANLILPSFTFPDFIEKLEHLGSIQTKTHIRECLRPRSINDQNADEKVANEVREEEYLPSEEHFPAEEPFLEEFIEEKETIFPTLITETPSPRRPRLKLKKRLRDLGAEVIQPTKQDEHTDEDLLEDLLSEELIINVQKKKKHNHKTKMSIKKKRVAKRRASTSGKYTRVAKRTRKRKSLQGTTKI